MTKNNMYELQVEMLDSASKYKRAVYKSFHVPAAPDFNFNVDDFEPDVNAFVRDAFDDISGQTFKYWEEGSACSMERANTSGWIK